MELSSALLILVGLVALVGGGEVLVRGAGGIARSAGMSPLLVGLTVVAFATSAPELAVTLDSVLGGNPGLAVGNVVGSNIANVLLVIGVSAIILPLAVHSQVVRRDIPVMVLASVVALLLGLDLRLTRMDGLVLLAILVVYLVVTVVNSRRAPDAAVPALAVAGDPAPPEATGPVAPVGDRTAPTTSRGARIARDLALVAVGVALLVVGAGWLVRGATQVAHTFGVSDLVIGLTVVAIGTSLPELATSTVAAMRGERDMAVGNVVGSCLFNLGAVLGLAALIAPDGVPIDLSAVRFDIPFMVATAIALLPVAFTGLSIARWEGALFAGHYLAYVIFLVLTATEHPALPAFGWAMTTFVIPLTLITLGVMVVQELRLRRRPVSDPAPVG